MSDQEFRVINVVKFNDGVALVVDRMPELKYTKMDHETIIGEDSGAHKFYGFELPSPGFVAFAGRKFELVLTDGSVIKCNGQWWALKTAAAQELFPKTYHVTMATEDLLRECYVFYGYSFESGAFSRLMNQAAGMKNYEYREYEKLLKQSA